MVEVQAHHFGGRIEGALDGCVCVWSPLFVSKSIVLWSNKVLVASSELASASDVSCAFSLMSTKGVGSSNSLSSASSYVTTCVQGRKGLADQVKVIAGFPLVGCGAAR